MCIYIHRSLKPRRSSLNDITKYEECIWLDISLDGKNRLLLGCICRSPNSDENNNSKLNQLLRSARDQRASHILVIGDFNFPSLTWKEDAIDPVNRTAEDAQFLESTRDAFLFQHVHEPTRYRLHQHANTLDLIFTNEEGMVSDLEVRDPLGKSDQSMITFQFHCHTTYSENSPDKYLYGKGDYDKLRHMMTHDWEALLSPLDAEHGWSLLTEKILQAQDVCIPKKKAYSSATPKKYRPIWMNNKTFAKIKKKHHAWKRYILTKSGQDYIDFTRARNQARRATRQAVKSLEKNIAKEAKANPKLFRKYASQKTKTRTGIADLETDVDGSLTTNEKDKAEVLATFFGSVFTHEDLDSLPCVTRQHNITPTETVRITEDVYQALKNLKPNKSPGPDAIHPRVLRELAAVIKAPLNIIFNKSMATGQIPETWIMAHITPIFKKGNRHLPSNYRPVSLTAVASKVMESLVRTALVTHMRDNGLFAEEQHGFVEGRSCTTQLISTLDMWTRTLDEGHRLDAVFMDFMKAFDTVPHQRLLCKLRGYGIDGELLTWIESF